MSRLFAPRNNRGQELCGSPETGWTIKEENNLYFGLFNNILTSPSPSTKWPLTKLSCCILWSHFMFTAFDWLSETANWGGEVERQFYKWWSIQFFHFRVPKLPSCRPGFDLTWDMLWTKWQWLWFSSSSSSAGSNFISCSTLYRPNIGSVVK
jgi:hypothetical protein